MRNKSALTRLLRGIVNLLSEESDRNPEFGAKLDELLASIPGKTQRSGRSEAKPEAEIPDIYQERKLRGEHEFRFWLRDQPVPVLHAIIRKHDLDSTRRTAVWKDAEKLASYIAERLQGRLERGSSFMRGGPEC
jgi:hypothetical protein